MLSNEGISCFMLTFVVFMLNLNNCSQSCTDYERKDSAEETVADIDLVIATKPANCVSSFVWNVVP